MLALFAVVLLLSGVYARKERLWLVTQADGEVRDSPDGAGHLVGTLHLFSYIVGVEIDARIVRITFPDEGFVQQRSLLRINSEVIDAELNNAESASSFSAGDGVLGSRGFSLSWIDQWPIGAGTLGALVGGTFGGDVIPVAVPNYYVASRDGLRKTLVRKFEKSRLSNATDADAFRLAREALRDGDFTTAEKRSRDMPRGVLGRFEYMADIVIATSWSGTNPSNKDVMSAPKSTFGSRFHAADRRDDNSSVLPSSKANNVLTRRKRAMRKDSDGGPRQEAWQGILASLLQDGSNDAAELDWGRDATSISGLDSAPPPPPPARYSSDSQPPSVTPPQKLNYLQSSYLELNGGVSSSFHLARLSSDANEALWRRVSVQHRSWFVSRLQQQSRGASKEKDDAVLVGRIRCNSPVSLLADDIEEEDDTKASSDEGCLSIAVQLARSTHVLDGYPPRVAVDIIPRSGAVKQNSQQQQQIRLGLAIGPSSEALGPHAYTCAAIQCVPSSPSNAKARMDYLSPGTVVCRHGHEVQIFASAAAQEGQDVYRGALEAWARFVKTVPEEADNATLLFDPKAEEIWGGDHDYGYNASKALELKERCWRRVDRALSLGRENLLKLHRSSVSSEMRRVELKLGADSRGNGRTTERKGRDKTVDQEEELLLQRSESLYQFGRYLFLSSASSHALNLQGVWGEGRVSVWNADYHLNVNLQMAYWAADSARLSHLSMPPLVAFLRKLRLEGSGAAKSLFSCPGWVALGNLDGLSFNPTLNSEPHWALCVSCGAWAALALWDHLSFAHVSSPSGAEAMEELLLSFRGIAEFFLVHMTSLGQGGATSTLHVGPSSSPENSYGLMPPAYLEKLLFEMSASSSSANQTDQVTSSSASSQSPERGDEGREVAPRQKRSPARRSVDGAGASNAGGGKSRRSGRNTKGELHGRALLSEEDKQLSERLLDAGAPEQSPGAPAASSRASLPENIANLLFPPPPPHLRVVKKNRRGRNTKELANTLMGLDPSLSQSTAFLAFSTALDLSVLRNVAVAYGLALDLDSACSSKAKPRGQRAGQFACTSTQSKDDRRIAARFLAAVQRLPYSALPVRGHNGAILEYPAPFPSAAAFPYAAADAAAGAGAAASGSASGLSSGSRKSKSGPRIGNLKGRKSANQSAPRIDWFVREDVDSQHRHFSSMHWLYPGLFQPSSGASVGVGVDVATSPSSLWRAANESLTTKHETGSGHTSWSASWEACLWARLGAGDLSWKALTRISEKYSTVRLMSLHPHLVKRRFGSSKCSTCYEEQLSTAYATRNRVRLKVDGSVTQRGANGEEVRVTVDFVMVHRENRARRLPESARQLATRDKSSFQLDGNLGYVAAVNEMLLQSHTPSNLRLLPALPAAWASGKVLGLGARGDVVVSMSWRAGRVHVARLEFLSPHPWNAGLAETSPGYFSWAPGALDVASQGLKLHVSFPVTAEATPKGKKKPSEAAKLSIKSSTDARGRSCASAASGSPIGSFQDAYHWLLGSTAKTTPGAPFADPSLVHAEGRGSLLVTLRSQVSWPCVVLLCAQLDDCEDL